MSMCGGRITDDRGCGWMLRMSRKMVRVSVCCIVFLLLTTQFTWAQQYTSLSGLIQVPSADMCPKGEARIGTHFLNKEFTPASMQFKGDSYHTGNAYLSVTPFSWMEVGYTLTLMKGYTNDLSHPEAPRKEGYYHKDRYFSFKIRPIKEGKWWPSIALGTNDPFYGSGNEKTQYYTNFYVAATKHIDIRRHLLGVHVAYRKWKRDTNHRWNGLVGGLTYQPSFQQNLRFIAEYTGNEVNIGCDWKLWNHLRVQASLQDGNYFSGGLCFCMNLL